MITYNKRIAMFSIHSDPLVCLGSQESGGQNIYVRHLSKELDKMGWEVDVFTRWDDPSRKQIINITKQSRIIRLEGEKIAPISKQKLFPILPKIYDNFLRFINFQNPYSLFHGHYWDGGWLAVQAHSQFSKPLVENFHSLGIIRLETKKKYNKNEQEEDYFLKRFEIEQTIIKESSVIISLSETEKESLQQFYRCSPEKIKVIPGGVDIKQWKPLAKEKSREILNLKTEEFILLYVGRLEWRKGIGTLISAARLLKEEIPHLKILIVGGQIFNQRKNTADFKEYQRLLKLTQDEGVEDFVRFVGRIPNCRLPVFYSACDILIVPSYYEPFGLVALEGMASRIPIIASRVDGLSVIIKDGQNGLLFEPHNAKELKEKVVLLYKSQELKSQVIETAFQEVSKDYSWNLVAQSIDNIYKSLIVQNFSVEKILEP